MNAATAFPQAEPSGRARVQGAFVELRGEPFYRIANCDAMEPFFMSIVSASDHYLFLSSTGGLTAGRKSPDHALFPYYTDDRIQESAEHTGSKTVLRIHRDGRQAMWEPFSMRGASANPSALTRNLYKSAYGNRILFEEENHELEMVFSYEWATSERFGFVRAASLRNRSNLEYQVELLDGLQNMLPHGVTRRFQNEYSTLVDGYKRVELDAASGLAMIHLTSIPVDRAEPAEALRTNVAW